MNGVRFYLEFPDSATKKRSGRTNNGHSGNVFAAFISNGAHINSLRDRQWEGLAAVLFEPNSPVATVTVSIDHWAHARCKRVSEALARKIHPRLFERLDESQ